LDERKKGRGAGREEEEESASARKKKTDAFLFSGRHQFPQYRGSRLCIDGEGVEVCEYPFGIGVDFQF
jgi:hypothetical protein